LAEIAAALSTSGLTRQVYLSHRELNPIIFFERYEDYEVLGLKLD
jgi:hypothetical protein